jgi:hypothetical protein
MRGPGLADRACSECGGAAPSAQSVIVVGSGNSLPRGLGLAITATAAFVVGGVTLAAIRYFLGNWAQMVLTIPGIAATVAILLHLRRLASPEHEALTSVVWIFDDQVYVRRDGTTLVMRYDQIAGVRLEAGLTLRTCLSLQAATRSFAVTTGVTQSMWIRRRADAIRAADAIRERLEMQKQVRRQ